MHFLILVLAAFIGLTSDLFAQGSEGYYRWPTTNGNQIVFVSEGDLWEVPVSGGMARRMTSASGEERFPMFSPDGNWIAFSGNYDGNVDVYVIPAMGGVPTRLTYHPAADWVAAWTPDGKIAFRTIAYSGVTSQEIFTISPQGGYPEKVEVPEAAHITFEPKGDRVAYTKYSLGFRTWKRYKGGWAEQIIVGSLNKHDYNQVTTWEGNNATPMWIGDRIYYVRNQDDRDNLWSMKPDGSDIKKHTAHKDWDVRWPSYYGELIAYSAGADICIFDVKTGQEQKISIQLPSENLQARDRFVSPEDYTANYALNADGKRIVLGARGELFNVSTERKSVIHQISFTGGAREKFPFFSKDGKEIFAWSDVEGEETLWAYPSNGVGKPRKVGPGTSSYNFGIEMSPDGKWGVCGNKDRKLALINLETGATSVLDSSKWEITAYEWSPDSRYVAYDIQMESDYNCVKIYDTKDKTTRQVTDPLFSSYSPTWDTKGEWLYFISGRLANAYNGANEYQFITLGVDQVFGLALNKDVKSPYLYKDDTIEGEKKDEDKDDDGDKKDKKDKKGDKDEDEDEEEKVDVKIEWDGLADRIIQIPVDAGNLFGLGAVEGKLYYVRVDQRGWKSGHDEDDPALALHVYDIKKKKDSQVVDGVNGYTFSLDRKKVVARKKSGFVVMDAGDTEAPKPDEDDPDKGLHLDEWTHDVDPRAEWKHIYWEAWRNQRDFFYDPNMHGVDWKKQGDRYSKLLDRILNRDELNDVLGQLFGELNAGHAYIFGGDNQKSKQVGVGLLGIDVTRESNGFYKIDRILEGDRWDEERTSPLNIPGINAKAGEYLVAIDRRPVSEVQNYLELLQNKADKLVMISLNDKPSLEGARECVVKTLPNEYQLRYWDWVYGRMDYVKQHGGEDIGYVHLSDMGGDGMEQFMREFYAQGISKKALIMDVRWNGGGNIATWILSQLDRKVWNFGSARNGSGYKGPDYAFWGPKIALCNEETGSDGETFSEGWKRLKLGPLVGKRTWGGWVGIRGGKGFIDGGGATQPEFTGWGLDSKWLIEGPGVTPDVDLQNAPKKLMDGVDEQLDYAIEYLKKEMKTYPKPPAKPAYPVKAATGPDK
ncbi:PDZ domain-containing protein [bacterium]|nr:PDZ domain-containing protein [bacterium]